MRFTQAEKAESVSVVGGNLMRADGTPFKTAPQAVPLHSLGKEGKDEGRREKGGAGQGQSPGNLYFCPFFVEVPRKVQGNVRKKIQDVEA